MAEVEKHLSIYVLAIHTASLVKCLFDSFARMEQVNWVTDLLILSYNVPFYVLDFSDDQVCVLHIFFPIRGLLFHFPSSVFLRAQVFVLENPAYPFFMVHTFAYVPRNFCLIGGHTQTSSFV